MKREYICDHCGISFEKKKTCETHENCCLIATKINDSLKGFHTVYKNRILNKNEIKSLAQGFVNFSKEFDTLYKLMIKNKKNGIRIIFDKKE